MLKGLSILELVVVMAIVAGLMITGALFLVKYQSSIQLQSAYTYTVESMKTMQNRANNSASVTVSGTRISPQLFALRINNNQINAYYCQLSGGGPRVHCDLYPTGEIQQFQQTYKVNVTATCQAISFTRLSAGVVLLNNSAFTSDSPQFTNGSCVITLTHQVSGDTRTINIDATLNKIDL